MIPRAFLFDQLPTPLDSKPTNKEGEKPKKPDRKKKDLYIHSFTLKPIIIKSNRFSSSYTTKAHTTHQESAELQFSTIAYNPQNSPFVPFLKTYLFVSHVQALKSVYRYQLFNKKTEQN